MGKKGYKHMTGVFGADSEHYLSRLFLMMNNPNGSRRPDLISINGRYDPPLSIESKSGVDGKVSLVSSQLHYAVTTLQDYEELFGQTFEPRDGDVLPGMDLHTAYPNFHDGPVAYYYALVGRTGEVTSDDVHKPFSSIQLEWLDQAIVPHDLAFWGFAIARRMRTSERLREIVADLGRQIQVDVDEQRTHYSERGTQDWQSFYLRDMRAIFEEDPEIATPDGVIRNLWLRRCYPHYHELKRIEIAGPNGTRIMVLAKPEHEDLFDRQLRGTVEERTPVLEKVHRARRRALGLLEKIEPVSSSSKNLFKKKSEKGDVQYSTKKLTERELERLRRLERWADAGEPLELKPTTHAYFGEYDDSRETEIPERPDDGIPI